MARGLLRPGLIKSDAMDIALQSTSCEMTEPAALSRDSFGSARVLAPLFRFTALNRFRSTRVAREPARPLPAQDQLQ